MNAMKKTDIQTRYNRGEYLPCLNVKCYHFPQEHQIAARLGCSDKLAGRAGEFAYQSAVESFWDQVQETAEFYFGKGVKAYSEGRSNGWLVVHNLPAVESWDAIAVSKWSRFAASIAADIAYRSSLDSICEAIEANQWHLEGAELYNFIDGGDGKTVCLAEMKQQAIAAGFAPVVR